LLESELFGHERGAFTGAVARKWAVSKRLTAARSFWTRSETSARTATQAAARPSRGGVREIGQYANPTANVRLVAATNKDLAKLVAQNQFRSDLYYRLNVFHTCSPLRDRRRDIPSLVRHFVGIYAERMNKQIERIPTDVMEALVDHSWPGNIRELQNFIERSVILADGTHCVLHLKD